MARRPRTTLLAAVSLLVTVTAPVRADVSERPVSAELRWTVPRDSPCIGATALAAAVDARLRRHVFDAATGPHVVVTGRAFRDEHHAWAAALTLRGEDGTVLGTRDLRTAGTSCEELSQAVPIVVALMVELARTDVVLHLPASRPQPPTSSRPRWGSTVGVVGSSGLLPGVSIGGRAAVDVGWEIWRARASATLWAPRDYASGAGAALVWAWIVRAELCAVLRAERLSLEGAACAGLGAGEVLAQGRGFDQNASYAGPLVNVTAGVSTRWTFASPWHLELGVTVGVPAIRTRFVFSSPSGGGTLFTSSLVFVEGEAALGLSFASP